MTDEELIALLRAGPEIVYRYVDADHAAADRIEELKAQASKDAKAHEKEIAVWSENYAALTAKREDARAEVLLQRAAQMAYEVWDDPEALAKAILALIPETKPQAAAIRKGGEG